MPDAPADSSLLSWVLAGIVTVIGTLASVVTFQWNRNETRNAKEIETLKVRAESCEADRNRLSIECATIRSRCEYNETRLHDLEKRLGQ